MRTLIFIIILVAVILGAVFFKHQHNSTRNDFSEKESNASRWTSILTGKWKMYEYRYNPRESWEDTLDFEFFSDRNFKANGIEYYYSNERSFGGGTIGLELVTGGGYEGQWFAKDDSSFFLQASKCSFKVINTFHGLEPESKQILSCDTLRNGYEFGASYSFSVKTNIVKLTEDSILIEGKSYAGGFTFKSMFIRQR